MGGHDHMHYRSIVESPDRNSRVQAIIASSNSYKFYLPADPSHDENYNSPAFGFLRETPVAQELFTVGYYIFTVDGPRVSVDFYSSENGCQGDCDLTVTPTLSFAKRETFGYSLNSQEFPVGQGESYTVVQDRFNGTSARILSGINESTTTVSDGRPLTKAVDTGWSPRTEETASDILSLTGMAEIPGWDGTVMKTDLKSDVYTLSMNYNHKMWIPFQLGRGLLGLSTKDESGKWINAVDKNFGGRKRFVLGPWKPGYELGTYGIDLRNHTAWAVINYDGDFAVAGFRHLPLPGCSTN